MTVMITGGSGFTGALLAKELPSKGNEVVIFDTRVPLMPIGIT
jgi:nucleoside-diphosphate-sugar epimerase